jgi:hypothetical protein
MHPSSSVRLLCGVLLCLVALAASPAQGAIQPWEEDKREQELKDALKADHLDRDAIQGMIELCEARGDFADAANWVVLLVKAGEYGPRMEERLNNFKNKIADNDDVPIWESRLDYFRSHDEPKKALREIAKLKERFTLRISRMEKWMLAYLAKVHSSSGEEGGGENPDPNVSGIIRGLESRLAELNGWEEELRGQLP